MSRFIGVLAVFLLVAPVAAADGELPAPLAALIEAQTRLVERTRDYRASLEPLHALQGAEVARAAAQVRVRKDLLDRGIASRRELEESELALAAARGRAAETEKRMAEADALMGETLAAIEVARMPKAAQTEMVTTPAVIRYEGAAELDLGTLETFFAARFGRILPVSARGQTVIHDRLGLDHRRAVDVAVHPESEEGRALIEYLRLHRIPFLAFRQRIPGASTGAHVHIGQTSPRLLPVRNPGG